MTTSCDCELIENMENMEVTDDNADSFNEGDLVFAKAIGYIAWPGIIVAKQRLHCMVNFLGSDDTRRIENAKIWLYSESSKSEFITQENLDYLEFRDAILIAEKLSAKVDGDKDNGAYCYRVLSQSDLEEQHGEEIEIQEEARQEKADPKVARQYESNQKKPGKEEVSKKKPFKEELCEEETGEEELGEEEHIEELGEDEHEMEAPSYEADSLEELAYGETNQQEEMIDYVRGLRSDQDSLNGGIEKKFIELVNLLRHSLRTNHKDYPSALFALEKLQEMTFSELLLVRNFEAVNSIYHICYLDTAHRNYNEAGQVKLLAKQLISHFASVIKIPDTMSQFMDLFQSLSSIYARFTYEFDPIKRQASEEEYCQEDVAVEEAEQEALTVQEALYPSDQDSLTEGVDAKFDQQIEILRRSLSFRRKDYAAALLAFDKLLAFTFTNEFLMPKYKAVYFIYYLSRSGCVLPWKDLAKATMVRHLANQLMVRFFAVFNLPGITTYDFMVHYCSLYNSDSSDSESDSE